MSTFFYKREPRGGRFGNSGQRIYLRQVGILWHNTFFQIIANIHVLSVGDRNTLFPNHKNEIAFLF